MIDTRKILLPRLDLVVTVLGFAWLAVFIAKFSLSVPTTPPVFMAGVVLLPGTLAIRLLSTIRRSAPSIGTCG